MKVAKLPLLQILFISFLICFFAKAADTPNKNQKILLDFSLGKVKGFSIPFEAMYQPQTPEIRELGFFLKVPAENLTYAVIINMKTNGIWINNGINFNCSASKTCKSQGPSRHVWIEKGYDEKREIVDLEGTLVKEQVIFEGGFTLPNADIFIAKHGNPNSYRYFESFLKGVFGLSFRRSLFDAPTFYEFLNPFTVIRLFDRKTFRNLGLYSYIPRYSKSSQSLWLYLPFGWVKKCLISGMYLREGVKEEGIVEKSIFSIYLNASDHGELLFGGYDPKKAGSEFHNVKWEYDQEAPGFSLPIKTIGYGDERWDALDSYIVVIDFDSEHIHVPKWIIDKIGRADHTTGCNLAPILEDIVIGFENLTLRIPSTVYTNRTSFEQPIDLESEISRNTDCTFLKELDEGINGNPKIVLGRQFLKYFYTVFDLEEKTAGFSTMSGFVPKSPVFEKAGGFSYPSWFSKNQITAFVALIIAGVFVCLIRKIQKRSGNTSRELVFQNIERGEAQYAVVNEHEEDSQQEGQDASEVTVEENA